MSGSNGEIPELSQGEVEKLFSCKCRLRESWSVRFWKRIDRSKGENECWEWQAGKDKDGYGKISLCAQDWRCHRVSFALAHGYLPILNVLHTCDNPPCCNPKHLLEGTARDNQRDKVQKRRQARGERHRSRLYPDQVPKGEQHGMAKLSEENVLEIRAYSLDALPMVDLAIKFGVSTDAIYYASRYKTWRHLP